MQVSSGLYDKIVDKRPFSIYIYEADPRENRNPGSIDNYEQHVPPIHSMCVDISGGVHISSPSPHLVANDWRVS